MQEADLVIIKEKISSGVLALATRTFILQIISFTATFILTILLSPAAFGIFFVVSAVIAFLSYFSDIGLAAALVQNKTEPTDKELATAFTIQQMLVISVLAIALLLSPLIVRIYNFDGNSLFLLYALEISFFLSSLKTIPSILLERKLEFQLLVIPQILETFSFYLVAIILAYLNFGVASFAWAALVRGIIGLFAIYIIKPWKVQLEIDKLSLKRLLKFGIPFQTNSLLALVKDDLMTIFLGKMLPIAQLGYIGWAKKWAEAPLRLIMDNIIRVTFPAYSRLQENTDVLGKAIAKSFMFLSLFIFPLTALLVIYIKPAVNIIPKYAKWEPAIISFYLFAISSVFASFSSPLVNALNAIGKIKNTLTLMVVWTTSTWLFIPIAIALIGFNGVAASSLLISITTIFLPVILIKRYINVSLLNSFSKPLIMTLLMVVSILGILMLGQSITILIISFIAGCSLYIYLTWLWVGKEIKPFLPKLKTI